VPSDSSVTRHRPNVAKFSCSCFVEALIDFQPVHTF
jgi:hypothetical protein